MAANSSSNDDSAGSVNGSIAKLNAQNLGSNEEKNMEEYWITIAGKNTAAKQSAAGRDHGDQTDGSAKHLCSLNSYEVLMDNDLVEGMDMQIMKIEGGSLKPTIVNLTTV